MSRKNSNSGQAAWRMLLGVQSVVMKRVDEELAAAGVLASDYHDVLCALSEAPNRRLRLCDLAERVQRTRSGMTRLSDRLEAAGLIYRENCPTDRRGAFAVLTDRGLAELRRTKPVYAKAVAKHFVSRLGPSEAETLCTAFTRVFDALREPQAVSTAPDR